MELILPALIVLLVSCGAIYAGAFYIRRSASATGGAERDAMMVEVNRLNAQIDGLLRSKDSFVGRQQFNFISSRLEEIRTELSKESEGLKQIEKKLEAAQKLVEEKETQQQEIKAAKEEDQIKVTELLASFDTISQESMALEQQLASSLKNLDSIMGELEMTQVQKEILNSLHEAVTNSGSRLRDLLTEYQTVSERLQMLSQQHVDLEEEYTRLVEQQLGE